MRQNNYCRYLILLQLLTIILCVAPAFGGLNFPTAIRVDKSIYFQKPDGLPVQINPAVYEVEQDGDSILNLHAVGAQVSQSIPILAIPANHDEKMFEASADLVPSPDNNPDKQHVLLSLPNGLALEAVGSYSGVFSRSALTWGTKASEESSRSTEELLSLDIDKAIYFKTVGGDPQAIQPGHYDVAQGDNGLILTLRGGTKDESINIETESLGTSAAVMFPEFNGNPDLELLMLGTSAGHSFVAIGSHSGTFPRGWGFVKKLGRGVKKGVKRAGSRIKRGAKIAHGKFGRHVARHVKKGIRAGGKYGKKYGRKVVVAHYKAAKKATKEVAKFCTKSVNNAYTCYKVGKTIASAAAS
ncbi:MAG: hypothetical protein ACPGYT_13430 [Nitrospirales bacterium]